MADELDTMVTRPDWEEFFRMHVLWPLVVQAVVTVACVPLHEFYALAIAKSRSFKLFIDRFIGRVGHPHVESPILLLILKLMQVVFSFFQVAWFAHESYDHDWASRMVDVERGISVLFMIAYVVSLLQGGFHPVAAWNLTALVDILTIVPLFEDQVPGHQWLNLRFLRAYPALLAYEYIQDAELVKDQVSEFHRRLAVTLLRLICLVICMSGTIFVLEILGDIPGLVPTTVPTNMGDLNFIQMNYWMVTTISTVGYGDYSPTTIPSQLVIIVFIIGGIMFFGAETSELMELRQLGEKGQLKYIPTKNKDHHIVLVGSGASRLSSMMETFLLEILDQQGCMDIPNVVILSETEYDPALKEFVRTKLPEGTDQKVFFLRGSTLSANDVERLQLQRSTMAFVLPGIVTTNVEDEDNKNILSALELQRNYPGLRLRLMLLESGSEQRAVSLGVPRQQCFTANGIKASLLAHSARVKGLVTLVSGLLQVTTEEECQIFLSSGRGSATWRTEYAHSVRHQIYGFCVGGAKSSEHSVVGLPFHAAAAKIYENSGEKVMLIAAQEAGRLMLNLSGVLEEGQVCMAIASSRDEISRFANRETDWRKAFLQKRATMMRQERMDMMDDLKGDGCPLAEIQVGSQTMTLDFTGSLVPLGMKAKSGPHPPSGVHLSVASLKVSVGNNAADPLSEEVDHFEKIRGKPHLIVLIVAETAWEQASMFIEVLRQDYLAPMQQPIVVLSPSQAPAPLRERYESQDCAFISGKVLNSNTLKMAGVDVAEAVITFRRGTWEGFGAAHIVMEDYEVITLTNLIQKTWKGAGKQDGYSLYEFGSTQAVELRELRDGEKLGHHSEEQGRLPRQASARAAVTNFKKKLDQRLSDEYESADLYRSLFARSKSDYMKTLSKQLLLLPSFAAGQAFSPDFFGSVLGHIYNFPATIEFIEAICMPHHNRQTSFLLQVRCPAHWVGRTFGDLLISWANGKEESGLLEESGPVLVIALYRRRLEDEEAMSVRPSWGPPKGNGLAYNQGYNVTLPTGSTVLNEGDLVTVLGPLAFGKCAAAKSLLWGDCPAGEATGSSSGQERPPPSAGMAATPSSWC